MPGNTKRLQQEVCRRFQADFVPAPGDSKAGVAANVGTGVQRLNGLRHPLERGTCGWYIYAGQKFSTEPCFFEPLHVKHLESRCPQILKYLGLPPGWRFLLAGDYEDIWFDPSLLDV